MAVACSGTHTPEIPAVGCWRERPVHRCPLGLAAMAVWTTCQNLRVSINCKVPVCAKYQHTTSSGWSMYAIQRLRVGECHVAAQTDRITTQSKANYDNNI